MAFGFNSNQVNLPHYQANQNLQSMFLQPQGNVYNINSTLEVANVPVGAGISVALCMPESVMYIKTLQNGSPMFYPYKIIPFTDNNENNKIEPAAQDKQDDLIKQLTEQINSCNKEIEDLKKKISTKKECEFNL